MMSVEEDSGAEARTTPRPPEQHSEVCVEQDVPCAICIDPWRDIAAQLTFTNRVHEDAGCLGLRSEQRSASLEPGANHRTSGSWIVVEDVCDRTKGATKPGGGACVKACRFR